MGMSIRMCSNGNGVLRTWEDRVVCSIKGRIIHFVLMDTTPNSVLAVVGIQRNKWHLTYTPTHDCIRRRTTWTTRKEVIKFLVSLTKTGGPIFPISDQQQMEASPQLKRLIFLMTRFSLRSHLLDMEDQAQNSEIVWSGDAWICGNQLKHYPAFYRNETKIPVHSMVWGLSKDRKYRIGYVKDLYENEQGKKMVRLLRFLSRDEAEDLIPKINPECREVFISSKLEEISADDIDGLATVLSPEHFKKCDEFLPLTLSFKCFMCHRQIERKRVGDYIISKLPGYSSQPVFSALKSHMPGPSNTAQNATERAAEDNPQQQCVQVKANDYIELLSQDSGMRGCWFRCKVLRSTTKRLKVQYVDVEDAFGQGKLEECVPATREAGPDSMGVRHAGRPRVRPCPYWDSSAVRFEVGAAVDAWWCNGWWEGFVIGNDTSTQTKLQIYFPGEKRLLTVERKDLRVSKDWIDDKWVDAIAKPDILSVITSMLNVSTPSERKKPAQDEHIAELLKMKRNEDWTPKCSASKMMGGSSLAT